jgi:hypothetical protein
MIFEFLSFDAFSCCRNVERGCDILKKNLPIYRWQHLKNRGGELVVTHNSEPMGGKMKLSVTTTKTQKPQRYLTLLYRHLVLRTPRINTLWRCMERAEQVRDKCIRAGKKRLLGRFRPILDFKYFLT